MKRVGIIVVLVCGIALAASLTAAWISAREHSQPVAVARPKPSPAPKALTIVAAPPAAVPSALAQQDLPANALFAVPNSEHIAAAIAAPEDQRVVVLSSDSNETYSLKISLVDLHTTRPKVTEIVTGANAEDFSTPVWSGNRHLYYEVDDENCNMSSRGRCGIYDLDPLTGQSSELLDHSTGGLAVSSDGKFLAFWDYSTGDKLTVFDISQKKTVREWERQTHTADDLVVRDMAFSTDGKSLLARTYEQGKYPLKEFDLQAGRVRTLSPNASGPVSAPDGTYFVESQIYSDNGNVTQIWKRVAKTGAEAEQIIGDFPYNSILSSGGRQRWASAFSDKGVFLFDTKTSFAEPLGSQCSLATVIGDGRAIYVTNTTISLDPQICGTPTSPPGYNLAMLSKLDEMKKLYAATATSAPAADQASTWFSLNRAADELANLMSDASRRDPNQFSALEKETQSAGVEIRYCEIGSFWEAQTIGYKKYLALLPNGSVADEAWWKTNAEGCGDFEPSVDNLEANIGLYQDFLKRYPNSSHAAEAKHQVETNQQFLLEQRKFEQTGAQQSAKSGAKQ